MEGFERHFITKLEGEKNFISWKTRMLAVLQAKELNQLLTQQAPEAADAKKIFSRDDAKCRSLILCSLSDEVLSLFLTCQTSRELWTSLEERYESNLRKKSVELRNNIHRIKLKSGEESTDEYILRAETMWQQLKMLGTEIEEDEIVNAVIQGLPGRYNVIALQIEGMKDPKISDVRRMLRINAEREELIEKREVSRAYTIQSNRKWDRKEYKHYRQDDGRKNDRDRIICYSCSRPGHKQSECWYKNKENSKDVEPRKLAHRTQRARMAKEEPKQEERRPEKTFCIKATKIERLDDEKNEVEEQKYKHHQKIFNDDKRATKKVPETVETDDKYSEEMERQIKEAESVLHEQYNEELVAVRDEAEERVMKAEMQLEKFQEDFHEKLNQIKSDAEEKIKKEIQEKQALKGELEIFTARIEKFFSTMFPSISITKTAGGRLCIDECEKEVGNYLLKLENGFKEDTKILETILKKQEENSSGKLKFEDRMENYQTILLKTHQILKNVQKNIEKEERKWRKELEMNEEDTLVSLDGTMENTSENGKENFPEVQEKEKNINNSTTNNGNKIVKNKVKRMKNEKPDEDSQWRNRNLPSKKNAQDKKKQSDAQELVTSKKVGYFEDQYMKMMNSKYLPGEKMTSKLTLVNKSELGRKKVKLKVIKIEETFTTEI